MSGGGEMMPLGDGDRDAWREGEELDRLVRLALAILAAALVGFVLLVLGVLWWVGVL